MASLFLIFPSIPLIGIPLWKEMVTWFSNACRSRYCCAAKIKSASSAYFLFLLQILWLKFWFAEIFLSRFGSCSPFKPSGNSSGQAFISWFSSLIQCVSFFFSPGAMSCIMLLLLLVFFFRWSFEVLTKNHNIMRNWQYRYKLK